MDPGSTSTSRRLDLGPVGDNGSATTPLLTSGPASGSHPGKMNEIGAVPRGQALGTRSSVVVNATSSRVDPSGGNLTARHQAAAPGAANSQPASYPTTTSSEQRSTASDSSLPQLPQHKQLALSRTNSQGTSSTNDADPVFTPPASGGRLSPGTGSVQESSQESQLLQLSQIAAAQERIPEDMVDAAGDGALSRKRMADGMIKHSRDKSSASPGQVVGHSRNTSTVSIASTAGSRIGELSAELKARLSYAMVKVNHGWQSHSIDQVETLASQAASPASSTSTIHLRNGSSASPQLSSISHRGSNNTTPATGPHNHSSSRPGEAQWRESPHSTSRGSSASPVKTTHGLAPPVSIQPAQNLGSLRRGSNSRHPPAFLPASHQASPHAAPRSPGQPSPYVGAGRHRTMAEAILVSPHTNVREQDAIESLLFMSSPGNSANLKHAFPSSSSQPLPSGHNQPQRTALPTSQPRKSLPTGRPTHHARSQSQTHKRVGFEKSPMEMDIDEPFGTPMSRGTPRRRINGSHGEVHAPVPRLKHLPVSAGLTVSSKPRPTLADEDIDRMLDRAAAEDSDSDGEIHIPVQRARRDGAHVVGA
ncbi:Cell cycle transcriptional repressor whi5 [Madurella fahalii]|uniref:Cell cycle transcriptional repressor whi5 n=1 Tax=Madurella fahalii TaxID=1157608 RepID=A0ABQ0GL00_9PEZI